MDTFRTHSGQGRAHIGPMSPPNPQAGGPGPKTYVFQRFGTFGRLSFHRDERTDELMRRDAATSAAMQATIYLSKCPSICVPDDQYWGDIVWLRSVL